MRSLTILLVITLWAFNSNAQYPRDMKFDFNWLFGDHPSVNQIQGNSLVRFKTAAFDTSYYLTGKNVSYYVQGTSISDTAGNLVLHSNGFAIYDSAFQKVPGADSLNYCGLDFFSCNLAFQTNYNDGYPNIDGMMLINKPGSLNEFWLINKAVDSLSTFDSYSYRLRLTRVLRSGEYEFTTLVKDTFFASGSFESLGMMELCRHANGRDWWLIQRKAYHNYWYVFLVEPTGIHLIKELEFSFHQPPIFTQAVFTPDGNKFIIAGMHNLLNDSLFVTMFDFDRCTGTLSNPQNLYWIDNANGNGSTVTSGCAVSPNSKYLYVASTYHIFQFDITVPNWQSTKTIIATYDGFTDSLNGFTTAFARMQLAPDNKIYITGGRTRYLNIIESPDEQGIGANVCQHCFKLPAMNYRSMPNFPNYRLGPIDGSDCDTLGIDNIDNVNEVKGNNRVNSFNLYPNPNAGTFIISSTERLFEGSLYIQVYDVLGRLVYSKQPRSFTNECIADISYLNNGVYRLIVTESKQQIFSSSIMIIK